MTLFGPLLLLVVATTLIGYFFNPLRVYLRSEGLEVLHHDHTPTARDGGGSFDLPLPVRQFAQYKDQHNARILRQELAASGRLHPTRNFAVAPYWCPDRSGNVLHNLFNTVTWAVITNRTILLQWVDTNPNQNQPADCEKSLQSMSWIPQWEDWKDQLLSTEAVPVQIDVARRRFDEIHESVIFPQIPDVFYERGNEIYRNHWSHHPFRLPEFDLYMRDLPKARQAFVRGLLSRGLDFLYGMLFRHMFLLMPEQEWIGARTANSQSRGAFSVVLHSRHVARADDGTIVQDEIKCLEQLLNNVSIDQEQSLEQPRSSYSSCVVYLLSDRTATVDKLSEWLRRKFPLCQVQRTPTPNNSNLKQQSVRPLEHGVNAGEGFFKDLAMGVQARSAIVGEEHQSSFKLLQEIVVYDREMAAVREHGAVRYSTVPDDIPIASPLLYCSLPMRSASGYSYGPGSAKFVQIQEKLPLLTPMRLWKNFLENHKHQVLEREAAENESWLRSGRAFAVTEFSCPARGERHYHDFQNRIVWSLFSNRTLLIKSTVDACDDMVPSWLPRWEDWSEKLELPEQSEKPDIDSRLIAFPATMPKISDATIKFKDEKKRDFVNRFFEYGSGFVSGMISRDFFNETLSAHSALRRTPNQIMTSTGFSLSVDTRGAGLGVEPDRTNSILGCLTTLMSNPSVASSLAPCHIYLLASNETAAHWKSAISEHIRNITATDESSQCVIRTAPSGEVPASSTRRQFWMDLAWGGRARDAWIGPRPSMILDEIEYQRVMEARMLGRFPIELNRLPTCVV